MFFLRWRHPIKLEWYAELCFKFTRTYAWNCLKTSICTLCIQICTTVLQMSSQKSFPHPKYSSWLLSVSREVDAYSYINCVLYWSQNSLVPTPSPPHPSPRQCQCHWVFLKPNVSSTPSVTFFLRSAIISEYAWEKREEEKFKGSFYPFSCRCCHTLEWPNNCKELIILEYSRGLYAKTPISTISQKEKKEAKGGACVFGCFPIPCLKLHGEKEPKQDKSGSSTQ